MSSLLLDTHVLLWWLNDDHSLSDRARTLIAQREHVVFISAVVIWEIRIKQLLGKLELPKDFEELLDGQGFEALNVTANHAHATYRLPLHHRDPFDRMLVAQAQTEGFTIVTRDKNIRRYKVATISV